MGRGLKRGDLMRDLRERTALPFSRSTNPNRCSLRSGRILVRCIGDYRRRCQKRRLSRSRTRTCTLACTSSSSRTSRRHRSKSCIRIRFHSCFRRCRIRHIHRIRCCSKRSHCPCISCPSSCSPSCCSSCFLRSK